MEQPQDQYQRRAIVGNRHFILADPAQPDRWALAGPVVISEDELGYRRYGPPRTVSSAQLQTWAKHMRRPFRIEEKFPVIRNSAEISSR